MFRFTGSLLGVSLCALSLLASTSRPRTLAWWPMDASLEGIDLSGANLLLTVEGPGVHGSFRRAQRMLPRLSSSRIGNRSNDGSCFFSGEGGYLSAPRVGESLDLTRDFTVEGWFRPSAPVRGRRILIANASRHDGWALALKQVDKACYLALIKRAGDQEYEHLFTSRNLAGSLSWSYLALQYEAEESRIGRWTLTLNTRKLASVSAADFSVPLSKPCKLTLGGAEGQKGLVGEMDIWRVTGGRLPESARLFTSRTKVLALWPFDRGSKGEASLENRVAGGCALKPGKDGGISSRPRAGGFSTGERDLFLDGERGKIETAGTLALQGGLGLRSLLQAEGLGESCEWLNGFTVEGWFKKQGDPDPRHPWYLAGVRDDASGWTLSLGHTSDEKVCWALTLSDAVRGGRIQFEDFFSDTDFKGDGEWHHIALVCDPSGGRGNGCWRLFIDGVLDGEIRNPSKPDRLHGSTSLYLGGRPSFSNSFVGELSTWRVSDGPLAGDALLSAVRERPRSAPASREGDPRALDRAALLLSRVDGYRGHPRTLALDGGAFASTLTEAPGGYGSDSRHLSFYRFTADGQGELSLRIEAPGEAPSAWGSLVRTPFGRLYLFYTFNGDRISALPQGGGGGIGAKLGWLVFRCSDDQGKTWSGNRYRIPLPVTGIDRQNPWQGKVTRFWNFGKPVFLENDLLLPLTKFGSYPLDNSGGWVLSSPNIIQERNPSLVTFTPLPVRPPGTESPEKVGRGPDRHSLVPFGERRLLSLAQGVQGSGGTVSSDGGRSWSAPFPFPVGGASETLLSRAGPLSLFSVGRDRYALVFRHALRQGPEDPLFISTGSLDSRGRWIGSEPELLFYTTQPWKGIVDLDWLSLPGGAERVVAVNACRELVMMPVCPNPAGLASGGTALPGKLAGVETLPGNFGSLAEGGLTLCMEVDCAKTEENEPLFSTFDGKRGIVVMRQVSPQRRPLLSLSLFDGDVAAVWKSGASTFPDSGRVKIAFLCDFRAGMISAVINGRRYGGEGQDPGWSPIPLCMAGVAGRSVPLVSDAVKGLSGFSRTLSVAEAAAKTR